MTDKPTNTNSNNYNNPTAKASTNTDSNINATVNNNSTFEINNPKNHKFDIVQLKKHINTEFNEEPLIPKTEQDEAFKQDLYAHYDFKFDDKVTEVELEEGLEELNALLKSTAIVEIPDYLKYIYNWAYLNPKNIKILDKNYIVNIILLGNRKKLIKAYLNEVAPKANMLHIGHNYGDLLKRLIKYITEQGHLDIIDVVPIQVSRAYLKLQNYKNIDIWQQDAAVPYHRDYDTLGTFFLLHELPLKEKIKVVNNMLEHVEKNNAKAIFIDYHNPIVIHPFKPIMRLTNTLLQPFNADLLDYDISEFALNHNKFNWHKTTFFGKMYQKVVVTLKK